MDPDPDVSQFQRLAEIVHVAEITSIAQKPPPSPQGSTTPACTAISTSHSQLHHLEQVPRPVPRPKRARERLQPRRCCRLSTVLVGMTCPKRRRKMRIRRSRFLATVSLSFKSIPTSLLTQFTLIVSAVGYTLVANSIPLTRSTAVPPNPFANKVPHPQLDPRYSETTAGSRRLVQLSRLTITLDDSSQHGLVSSLILIR